MWPESQEIKGTNSAPEGKREKVVLEKNKSDYNIKYCKANSGWQILEK